MKLEQNPLAKRLATLGEEKSETKKSKEMNPQEIEARLRALEEERDLLLSFYKAHKEQQAVEEGLTLNDIAADVLISYYVADSKKEDEFIKKNASSAIIKLEKAIKKKLKDGKDYNEEEAIEQLTDAVMGFVDSLQQGQKEDKGAYRYGESAGVALPAYDLLPFYKRIFFTGTSSEIGK